MKRGKKREDEESAQFIPFLPIPFYSQLLLFQHSIHRFRKSLFLCSLYPAGFVIIELLCYLEINHRQTFSGFSMIPNMGLKEVLDYSQPQLLAQSRIDDSTSFMREISILSLTNITSLITRSQFILLISATI
jgi:hypothetical protein